MRLSLYTIICMCCVAVQGQDIRDVLHATTNFNEIDCLNAVTFDATEVNASHATFVGLAMKKGFWKCAKEISTIVQASGVDVRNVFEFESRLIMKELADLKSAVETHKSASRPTISPAYQWAQSTEEIFINVKFSHKLDAPATLNVETEEVKWTNNTLSLRASDGRKIFALDIDFLRDIVPEASTYSMASVGRMTFTIRKHVAPSNWPRLTKTKKKANNVHFWWELHEKHSSALEALNEDSEEEEDTKKKSKSNMKSATKAAIEKSATPPAAEPEPVNAEAEAVKEEMKNAEKNHRDAIKILDDEIVGRKREVDKRCREEKEMIDNEATSRRNDLIAARDALLAELGAKLNNALRKEDAPGEEKSEL